MLHDKLRVLIYDDNKEIIDDVVIASNTENFGYHTSKGIWHQVIS